MLNRIRGVACILLLLANLGCASERLYVKVVDDEGNPVTNGIVRVGFSTSHVLFGGGNRRSSKSGHAEGCTDKDGNAVVSRFMIGCQKGQGLDSRGHLSSGGGRILTAVGGVLWYNWRR